MVKNFTVINIVIPVASRDQKVNISNCYICLINAVHLDFLQSHYTVPKFANYNWKIPMMRISYTPATIWMDFERWKKKLVTQAKNWLQHLNLWIQIFNHPHEWCLTWFLVNFVKLELYVKYKKHVNRTEIRFLFYPYVVALFKSLNIRAVTSGNKGNSSYQWE